MPFTVSHAVVALPLTAGPLRGRLVPAALVIGSMVPDLPYFLPVLRHSGLSHSAVGVVSYDLALGLLVFALWELALRAPASDLSPTELRRRLPVAAPLTAGRVVLAAVSVVVGAATHALGDTFTHADRWGTTRVAALTGELWGRPAFTWLQWGCGVAGLAVLAGWGVWWWHRTLPGPAPVRSTRRDRRAAWAVLVGGTVAAFLVILGTEVLAAGELVNERVAFRTVVRTMAAGGVVAGLLAAAWWLRYGRAPVTPP